MNLAARILPFAFALVSALPGIAQEHQLPRSSPEAQGVSSEGLRNFIESADREINSMHSFMMLRNGHVVAEAWWAPETPEKVHTLWSVSKSFTSTAVGFAVAEGKLSLDDLVLDFFPDDAPEEPSRNLRRMRVRDLLTMTSGHQEEPEVYRTANWIKAFLAAPVPHRPGIHFKYNTPGSYALSAIVQKATGETVHDYLKPRLYEPLGIEGARWEKCPMGVSFGGFGLFVKTEDLAKFGQLYLQGGKWQGKQVLPKGWAKEATTKQTSTGSNPKSDWEQGYGYQFWRCRGNGFRGDGKDGQFCIVLPDQNAVIVMTANTGNMAKQLELVWTKLVPAMNEGKLEENPEQLRALRKASEGLKAKR